MNNEDRDQMLNVLKAIPLKDWKDFIGSENGSDIAVQIRALKNLLKSCRKTRINYKPYEEVLDLFGTRILSADQIGFWIRKTLLRKLPRRKWNEIIKVYMLHAPSHASSVHGNMKQARTGSVVIAEFWHRGSLWAREFCRIVEIPECYCSINSNISLARDSITPVKKEPRLHDFQLSAYKKLMRLLLNNKVKSGILSMPTGAGKTRVVVEALCDYLSRDDLGNKNFVIWIASRTELLQQAWKCFEDVWRVAPERNDNLKFERKKPLEIIAIWNGRNKPCDIDLSAKGPTVIIASRETMNSWSTNDDGYSSFYGIFPKSKISCIVIDEAHETITHSYKNILNAFGARIKKNEWKQPKGSPHVVGLTATPWRSNAETTRSLIKYFETNLLSPDTLGKNPVKYLQAHKYLSKIKWESLLVSNPPSLTSAEIINFKQYLEVPNSYLKKLGVDTERNIIILKRLLKIKKKTIVFASSVEHAEQLTLALNNFKSNRTGHAAVVSAQTPASERYAIIQRFKDDPSLRYLCNFGILTAGFDAPMTEAIVITRPTTSTLLFEQMVGRGMRGTKNGGTSDCLVVEVKDNIKINGKNELPREIMSYKRVLNDWNLQ